MMLRCLLENEAPMPASQRTTVYLKSKIYRALKVKSALTDSTVSELVNEAVELTLKEDAEDRKALRKGAKQRGRPLEDFVRELKRDGLL